MKIKGKIVNDEGQEWISDFDLEIDGVEVEAVLNYDSLSRLISKLIESEELNIQLKQFVRCVPLVLDLVPVIIYTEIDELDLTPLYKFHYEYDSESLELAQELLKEKDEGMISEFFSENIYSVEALLDI